MGHGIEKFIPLNIAVLTVSDTRDDSNDASGHLLVDKLVSDGHHLAAKVIVADDVYQLRAQLSAWIVAEDVQAVLITGGTGFGRRDVTPQAIRPLLDTEIDGFGELFRAVSHEEIGTSTLQSRAFAGLANHTLIFSIPGSSGACRTAWESILREQLDSRHLPCNFVQILLPQE